ncbi:hypothetical protein chiPu_0006447 [Chiloscyllium punctatum]|uniref:Uncharacterized protein n=1 Tax=Chiloscyllium punctatum TaxID=137246 RepID=A0A401SCA6_CHIPU|nr:hypothetical protein [Chiloscyllium punctatum]
MLEDFYSDFFPTPLTRLAAPQLRESCEQPAASRRASEAVRRAAPLFGEPFVKEALSPQDGGSPAHSGKTGGSAGPGLSVESGDQPAAGKVPGPRCWAAPPPKAASARTPSPDLVVPDSDDMEEAEENRSKWERPRCPPAAVREGPPITSLRTQGADDASARLVPAAREAPNHKEDLMGPASPAVSQENEAVSGDCGVTSFPHSVTELQDQVVIEYWLPEE